MWGTDGRKMSKSYNNTISIGEDEESTRKKIMAATTDPARVRRTDKGNPENCGIFYLHKLYSTEARVAEVDAGCRTAGIGCVDCKKWLLEKLASGTGRSCASAARSCSRTRPGWTRPSPSATRGLGRPLARRWSSCARP